MDDWTLDRLKGPWALGRREEAAARRGRGGELVVERIVEGEEVAELGRERCLHFWAEEFLLILLLGLVAAAVEGVERGAVALRAVVHSAMPRVGVHDDDGAGGRGDESLRRMRGAQVGQLARGEAVPAVCRPKRRARRQYRPCRRGAAGPRSRGAQCGS